MASPSPAIPTNPPSRSMSPDDFNDAVDAYIAWQRAYAIWAGGLGGEILTDVVQALSATSASSVSIGTGSKVFTIRANKGFAAGQPVVIASVSDLSRFMFGVVVSYSGTTLTVTVALTGGSGSANDWSISISGPQGGITGGSLTGDLKLAPQVTVTAASTTNIGAATSNSIILSGSAQIDAFDAVPNSYKIIRASGSPLIKATAISNMAVDLPLVTDMVIELYSNGSGVWRLVSPPRRPDDKSRLRPYVLGTIADDAVAVIPTPGGFTGRVSVIPAGAGAAATPAGDYFARNTGSTNIREIAMTGTTARNYLSSALAGTTGPDNAWNFGFDGTNLYVENRSGAAVALTVYLLDAV